MAHEDGCTRSVDPLGDARCHLTVRCGVAATVRRNDQVAKEGVDVEFGRVVAVDAAETGIIVSAVGGESRRTRERPCATRPPD